MQFCEWRVHGGDGFDVVARVPSDGGAVGCYTRYAEGSPHRTAWLSRF
jgi:hypothetical protein